MLGDWAVYPGGDGEILAQPAADGAARTLLPKSDKLITGADGAVCVAGGPDPDDWAVRRITLRADGPPAVAVHVLLPRQTVYDVGGVVVDQRQLLAGTLRVPLGVSLATTYLSGSALSLTTRRTESPWRTSSAPGSTCGWSAPEKATSSGFPRTTGYPHCRVKEGIGPAVSVGAPCILKEIQVVDRWIYWSCGPTWKAGVKAGVYDRTTKHVITVPSGYAELADDYLVSQNETAAKLEITYFPGAVPPTAGAPANWPR
ncbi:hypothetical protein [Streptomyces sp. NPDC056244]|uniref:hypothetical protein n=1 Tax=Streptomyces sp. NPDC056244 TaxID=3345762 RepID=UPI0035E10AEC